MTVIFARLALEIDEDRIVELAEMAARESAPDTPFDELVARKTFRSYLLEADPTIIVAERNREVIGMVTAAIHTYRFAAGHFVSQELLYVQPESRGSQAAALLMRELERWSRTLGAREITGGNNNSLYSDRTLRFSEKLGFGHVGWFVRKRLDGQE